MYPWNQFEIMVYQHALHRSPAQAPSQTRAAQTPTTSTVLSAYIFYIYGVRLLQWKATYFFFYFYKERSLFMYLFLLVQITPRRCRRSSSRTGSGSWAASLKPSVPFTTREPGLTTLPQTSLGFGVLWSSNWRTTPPVLPGTQGSSSKPWRSVGSCLECPSLEYQWVLRTLSFPAVAGVVTGSPGWEERL